VPIPTTIARRALPLLLAALAYAGAASADDRGQWGSRGADFRGAAGNGGHDSRGQGVSRPGSQSHEWRGHSAVRSWDTRPSHALPPRGFVAAALPPRHHVVFHHGARYYFAGGVWYRPYGPRFIAVAPPIGVVVHVLPPVYTRVWIHSRPYYYANDVYYVPSPQGYVVTQPPSGEVITEQPATSDVTGVTEQPATQTAGAPPGAPLFIYPRQGQDPRQQDNDRNECHAWAVNQTGYDPNVASNDTAQDRTHDKYPDYIRALSACLDGRGYTVK